MNIKYFICSGLQVSWQIAELGDSSTLSRPSRSRRPQIDIGIPARRRWVCSSMRTPAGAFAPFAAVAPSSVVYNHGSAATMLSKQGFDELGPCSPDALGLSGRAGTPSATSDRHGLRLLPQLRALRAFVFVIDKPSRADGGDASSITQRRRSLVA